MIYTKPGFIYILIATLLCCCYYGIELSNGPLVNITKSFLACWLITSLIIASIIFGIKKVQETKPELITLKYIMLMYGLSFGTLLSSSLIIFSET
jgi:hypothetical protein